MALTRPFVRSPEYRDVASQARRAATSAAANYRAVCLARSRREFTAKLGVVLEEIDEAAYWLPLLRDAPSVPSTELEWLIQEANQLSRIFGASRRTAANRSGSQ